MSKIILYLLTIVLINYTAEIAPKNKLTVTRDIDFNSDWEFHLEGLDWEPIDLPHDFSIIQPFNENLEGESGFFPGGLGLYRKSFVLPKIEEGQEKSIILYFYGSYKDTYVFINRVYVGENHYGYNSFGFDLSDHVICDGVTKNVLEVRVDHQLYSSRFYSGSGIFRDVTLSILGPVHISLDGVKITTPNIAYGIGTVNIETEIESKLLQSSYVTLDITIRDNYDRVVARYTSPSPQEISGTKILEASLVVPNPKLWSDKTPNLYYANIKLLDTDGSEIDNYTNHFGFRYFEFTQQGFFLNGKATKLNGVSEHHDYGAIGSVDNYDAAKKRFLQLMDMGINSLRTTHNIASKNWINLCDELGIIVVEESFDGWSYSKNGNTEDFGKYWLEPITSYNTIIGGKPDMLWYEFVLRSMVKRDRNNPSIVMWSIGNEIQSGAYIDETYPIYCRNMITWGQEIDSTRPFTTGDNSHFMPNRYNREVSETIHELGGVIGYNYANQRELREAAEYFGSVYLSESASAINSRSVYSEDRNGYLKFHDGKYHLTSYDTSWVPWGTTAHESLWYTLTNDFVSGQYVWTGFDYIGEPTPWNGQKPGSETGEGPIPNSAYFGIIDTCGYPKDTYYLYRSQLNHDSYTAHIVSAWDINNMVFHGLVTQTTPVVVYTNAHYVELYRDDKTNPICAMTRMVNTTEVGHIFFTYKTESFDEVCEAVDPTSLLEKGKALFGEFKLIFKEGTKLYLKAYNEQLALIDKSEIVGNQEITAPNLNRLTIDVKVDKTEIKADGKSLVYAEVKIIDDNGVLNTLGDNQILFTLEGQGKILGVDNGDQATVDKYQQKSVLISQNYAIIKAYAGKALAIISSTKTKGAIYLTVSSIGLGTTTIRINTV